MVKKFNYGGTKMSEEQTLEKAFDISGQRLTTPLSRKIRSRRSIIRQNREEINVLKAVVDVSDQELTNARNDAHIDELTGLPDRARLFHDLNKQIADHP